MRATLILLAALTTSGAASAQQDSNIWPDFEIGKTGDFRHRSDSYFKVLIVEIIDKETMLMHLGTSSQPDFILQKYPTRGLADDKRIELKGNYKCVDTRKYLGTTYYVIEPHQPKPKK